MTIDFPRETEIETKNEMDAVLQAGRVLMESGAEIYRIEDTMGHMAKSLGIRDFSTYVVNRGVMISGLNRSGLKESRVLATSLLLSIWASSRKLTACLVNWQSSQISLWLVFSKS